LNFTRVYLSITDKTSNKLELFANWAKTLLQDFNEIDRYLLDLRMLSLFKDIEDIKRGELKLKIKLRY
jgi:hypothetical protein